MVDKKYQVPYSRTFLEFAIPTTMQVTVAVSRPAEPIQDVALAIKNVLVHPTGSPPLRELATMGQRVCIVFTDITRSSPDYLLVPALLEELEKNGIRDQDITLLCGIGMHRSSSTAEKISKLGAELVNRYRVSDHEPQNPAALVDLGMTSDGVPIQVNRLALDADLLIATGIVEPHQYAGYSGGRKTLAIGAAGEATIACTHGPAFVDHPGTRLGRIEGNPFHAAVTEVAQRAGLRFILNVVVDDDKRILKVAAGEPQQAFHELVAFAKTVYEAPIPYQYDVAIGGVGYPKDTNLYQASRAPTYLYFAPTPVVRPGGFLIIPARCEEGAGLGVGEMRFLAAMQEAPDVQAILQDARLNGYPPGQQRAFVLAKVLEQVKIIIVGSECPELVRACKMLATPTIEQALELASQEVGKLCKVLIVPHAMLTLPVINPGMSD